MVVCIHIWTEPRCDHFPMDDSTSRNAPGVPKNPKKCRERHVELGGEHWENRGAKGSYASSWTDF